MSWLLELTRPLKEQVVFKTPMLEELQFCASATGVEPTSGSLTGVGDGETGNGVFSGSRIGVEPTSGSLAGVGDVDTGGGVSAEGGRLGEGDGEGAGSFLADSGGHDSDFKCKKHLTSGIYKLRRIATTPATRLPRAILSPKVHLFITRPLLFLIIF